jgi:hypothetical protein
MGSSAVGLLDAQHDGQRGTRRLHRHLDALAAD